MPPIMVSYMNLVRAVSRTDRAVASAREAFNDGRWRNKPVYERQAVLNKLADLVDQHREELAF